MIMSTVRSPPCPLLPLTHPQTSFTIPWESESSGRKSPVQTRDKSPQKPRPRTRASANANKAAAAAAPPPPQSPESPLLATALAEYIPPVKPGRTMLWLALFSLAEHFQSVRRKGDGDSGPAAVEDKCAIPHQKDASEAARRERGEVISKPAPSAKVAEVLASLPPGHGITVQQAEGVLARVKGDLGEAVEILLQDVEIDSMSDTTTSDQHVDRLLKSPFYRENSASLSSQSDGETSRTSDTSKMTTPDLSGDEKSKESLLDGLGGLQMLT